MFSFKSKKKSITSELLWTIIIADYSRYMKECKVPVDEESRNELLTKLDKLKESGLSNTRNYISITNMLSKLSENRDIYKFLKYTKETYPDSIVIPWKSLLSLTNKYNLECAPLNSEYYDKLIPTENIEELLNVKMSQEYIDEYKVNSFAHVDSVTLEFSDDSTKDERSAVVNVLCRMPFIVNMDRKLSSGYYSDSSMIDLFNNTLSHYNLGKIDRISDLRMTGMKGSDWIICAPSEDIKLQSSINVRKKSLKAPKVDNIQVEDPLVGKFCRYGFIVFSKWGKEATLEEVLNWK